MNKWQAILLLVSGVPWAAMWLFPPWAEWEQVPHVYQGSGPLPDTSDHADDVREIRSRPAGYAWGFTGPQRRELELQSVVTYRVDDSRLALQWALLQIGLSGLVVFLATVPMTVTTWRARFAARIPVMIGWLLILIWFLPIQTFLLFTLEGSACFPVLGLTMLGLLIGVCLPESYLQPRRVEAEGGIYARLGVRRFRNFVSNGDLVVRLMRWIDPNALALLNRSTLADRDADTRLVERVHSAELLGSLPTVVWAVMVGEAWFAIYLVVANIPKNVYPILLQRYTRARLEHIRSRVHNSTEVNQDTDD